MRRLTLVAVLSILVFLPQIPALSADLLWRLTHNDQDALLIGTIEKIDENNFYVRVAKVISGEQSKSIIKVKINQDYVNNIGGIHKNDKMLLSLDKKWSGYAIKWNMFKVSTMDYRYLRITSSWPAGDKAALEYYINSNGKYNDFTINAQDDVVYGDKIDYTKIDLNGDGITDTIKFSIDDPYKNNYTLSVNDVILPAMGDNLDGYCKIVDIDTKDKIKEIIVCESGPSGDYATAFYYYDGKRLIPMGKIQGALSNKALKINGSGIIKTTTRGKILQTWFYPDTYIIGAKHLLKHIDQDTYQMNTKVKVKKALALQKSRNNKQTTFILKPGEEATILSSDNKEWCLVRNSKGEQGWFAVDDYIKIRRTGLPASEFFEGLCNAD